MAQENMVKPGNADMDPIPNAPDLSLLREVDRLGTGCEKWDALERRFGRPDLIAMWVADMDFAAPQPVLDAITGRVAHGAFGYQTIPEGWKDAIVSWERDRHGAAVSREWIRYAPGVVPALYWLVRLLTAPGEACLIQTPVYYPFRHAILDNERTLVTHDLVNEGGCYHVDFDRFEQDIVTHQIRLFILCSPHNPVGRVWSKEELARMWEICRRHGVFVLSDEIHRDLVTGPRPHCPTSQVTDTTTGWITLASASKTFNLASLGNAYMLMPDETIRTRFDAQQRAAHPGEGSILGFVAAEAAFREGGPWLAALLEQLRRNEHLLRERLALEVPEAVVSPLEGTYLLWVDLRGLMPEAEVSAFMRETCRIAVDNGEWFGEAGKGFIRINLATPQWRVAQVADRLAEGAAKVRSRKR